MMQVGADVIRHDMPGYHHYPSTEAIYGCTHVHIRIWPYIPVWCFSFSSVCCWISSNGRYSYKWADAKKIGTVYLPMPILLLWFKENAAIYEEKSWTISITYLCFEKLVQIWVHLLNNSWVVYMPTIVFHRENLPPRPGTKQLQLPHWKNLEQLQLVVWEIREFIDRICWTKNGEAVGVGAFLISVLVNLCFLYHDRF